MQRVEAEEAHFGVTLRHRVHGSFWRDLARLVRQRLTVRRHHLGTALRVRLGSLADGQHLRRLHLVRRRSVHLRFRHGLIVVHLGRLGRRDRQPRCEREVVLVDGHSDDGLGRLEDLRFRLRRFVLQIGLFR